MTPTWNQYGRSKFPHSDINNLWLFRFVPSDHHAVYKKTIPRREIPS